MVRGSIGEGNLGVHLGKEDWREIEKVAVQAVREAGSLIRDKMGQPSVVEAKAPADYVTEVDSKCEEILMESIKASFPDHTILSEETPFEGWSPGITWIIDPLDGTTNFIHGFPMVAVSLAVAVDASPVLGIVWDPLREELFLARKGEGAELNGRPIRVRKEASISDALMATGFPHRAKYYLGAYVATMKKILEEANDLRRAGSAALDLAYVACGRLDGFWEPGLKTWDVAAGSLLVLEAGGVVTDFWGRGDYLFNGHIIAGPPLIHRFLLEKVLLFLAPALEENSLKTT